MKEQGPVAASPPLESEGFARPRPGVIPPTQTIRMLVIRSWGEVHSVELLPEPGLLGPALPVVRWWGAVAW